jgi:hypothetical protein
MAAAASVLGRYRHFEVCVGLEIQGEGFIQVALDVQSTCRSGRRTMCGAAARVRSLPNRAKHLVAASGKLLASKDGAECLPHHLLDATAGCRHSFKECQRPRGGAFYGKAHIEE